MLSIIKTIPAPNETPEPNLDYLEALQCHELTTTNISPGQRQRLATANNLLPSLLDNDILPLFGENRWPELKSGDHGLLLPALRIATKLMTEPLLRPWWKHTLFGELDFDERGRRYLKDGLGETTDYAARKLQTLLMKDLLKTLSFSFCNLEKKGFGVDGCTFGTMREYLEFISGSKPSRVYRPFKEPRVALHMHYLFSLKFVSEFGSEDELKNIHLRIAITLCHELAHVVWKYRIDRDLLPWQVIPPQTHKHTLYR